MSTNDYPEFVSLREAAKILNLSYGMLRKGVNSGRFPAINSGVKFFVSPEQIKAILEQEAVETKNIKAKTPLEQEVKKENSKTTVAHGTDTVYLINPSNNHRMDFINVLDSDKIVQLVSKGAVLNNYLLTINDQTYISYIKQED